MKRQKKRKLLRCIRSLKAENAIKKSRPSVGTFCAYKLKLLGPVGSVGADVGPLLGHDELAADNVLNVEASKCSCVRW